MFDAEQINPDTQCAVPTIRSGGRRRCRNNLDCRLHSEAQKRDTVTDRSRPYEVLRAETPLAWDNRARLQQARTSQSAIQDCPATAQPIEPAPQQDTTEPVQQLLNLDIQCGAKNPNNSLCENNILCKKHSESEKQVVAGRSLDFSTLKDLYDANRIFFGKQLASKDVNANVSCAVALPGGGSCRCALDCSLHGLDQRAAVKRTFAFVHLLELQKSIRKVEVKSLTGYGLALAPYPADEEVTRVRDLYRRDGMQSATLSADLVDGDVRESSYTILDPAGEALNRVRQLFLGEVQSIPQHDIDKLLPQVRCRTSTSHSMKLYSFGGEWCFCYAPVKVQMPTGSSQYANVARRLEKETDACIIKAPQKVFNIKVQLLNVVAQRLVLSLQRIPFRLMKMSDHLKRRLLLHSLSSSDSSQPLPKMEYIIDKAFVDNKPCLVLPVTYFDSLNLSPASLQVAIPIFSTVNKNEIARPQSYFEVVNRDEEQLWLGRQDDIEPAKKRQLLKLAELIVSQLHFTTATQTDIHAAVAQISRSYGAQILAGPVESNVFEFSNQRTAIAIYDRQSNRVRASAAARSASPYLCDIENIVDGQSGDLVVQTINARYWHTLDHLLAWSDGANAADLHREHGVQYFSPQCACSADEAESNVHTCHCGKIVACKSLAGVYLNDNFVFLCLDCREPAASPSNTIQLAEAELQKVQDRQVAASKAEADKQRLAVERSEFQQLQAAVRSLQNDERARNEASEKANQTSKKANQTSKEAKRAYSKAWRLRNKHTHRLPEKPRLKHTTYTRMWKEHNIVYPMKAQPVLRNAEIADAYALVDDYFEEIPTGNGWQWKDDYFTTKIVDENSMMMASIEAFEPVCFLDSRPRIHVASNMGITRRYANSLCGLNSRKALDVFHHLDASSDDGKPIYRELMQQADDLYLIGSQIHYSSKQRLQSTYTPQFIAEFQKECATGVATMAGCERIDTIRDQRLWSIKTNSDAVGKDGQEASLPDIEAVKTYISDLEANVHKTMRRINGVPYPYRGGPDPEQWSWVLFYRRIGSHLVRIRTVCGSRHIVTMTVSRLILAFCRQVLLGREAQPSQLLDVPVSVYERHLLEASAGKADHARAYGTGLAEEMPITLASLNPDLVNLCVEPWLCNTAKGNRDDETDRIRDDFRKNYVRRPLPKIDMAVRDRYVKQQRGVSTSECSSQVSISVSSSGARQVEREPVLQRRNMFNLSQTCYMSTVLQTLWDNTDIREFCANMDNFVYKEPSGELDVSLRPNDLSPGNLSDEEMSTWRQRRRVDQRLLIMSLRELFGLLDQEGERLSADTTKKIMRCLGMIDKRWRNESEESAQLLNMIVDQVISASDRSEPFDVANPFSSESSRLAEAQEVHNRSGNAPIKISDDATRLWEAFLRDGHDSALTELLFNQTVTETACGDPSCQVISRGFQHAHALILDFPRDRDDTSRYDVDELIDNWAYDTLDEDSGHSCEYKPEHERGFEQRRCFTRLAKHLALHIRRGGIGIHDLNDVQLPEQLDMSIWYQSSDMPSSMQQRAEEMNAEDEGMDSTNDTTEGGPLPYTLVRVNTWKEGHYRAYLREPSDDQTGNWIEFNDLNDFPVRKSPWEGLAEGELVHYAVYQRSQEPANPETAGGRITPTDEAMQFYDQSPKATEAAAAGAQQGSTASNDAASTPSLPTGSVRGRPESSQGDGFDPRRVRPRTDEPTEGRKLENLEAREARLQLAEASLARQQNELRLGQETLAESIQSEQRDLLTAWEEVRVREQTLNEREDRMSELQSLETDVQNMRQARDQHRAAMTKIKQEWQDYAAQTKEQRKVLRGKREELNQQMAQLQQQMESIEAEEDKLDEAAAKKQDESQKELARLRALLDALYDI